MKTGCALLQSQSDSTSGFWLKQDLSAQHNLVRMLKNYNSIRDHGEDEYAGAIVVLRWASVRWASINIYKYLLGRLSTGLIDGLLELWTFSEGLGWKEGQWFQIF